MKVSLVIPGRNASGTIRVCLQAVIPLLDRGALDEIIFVDDGSTDGTAQIVAEYPVACLAAEGEGPGAARNTGWRAARHAMVWFVDSDCVPEPDALDRLLTHLKDSKVGAVGGSLGIAGPQRLLACLVHEEIMVRHHSMSSRVDFLAAANVVYRRELLERLGGFDERYLKAQDADLALRALEGGYELAFEIVSRVKHHYIPHWGQYLYSQARQGFWRVQLHLSHRGRAKGDSYSRMMDHLQPPLAMLVLAALPALFVADMTWVPIVLAVLLAAVQTPMTCRLLLRKRQARYVSFALLGFLRAFWRGAGMIAGTCAVLGSGRRRRDSVGRKIRDCTGGKY